MHTVHLYLATSNTSKTKHNLLKCVSDAKEELHILVFVVVKWQSHKLKNHGWTLVLEKPDRRETFVEKRQGTGSVVSLSRKVQFS